MIEQLINAVNSKYLIFINKDLSFDKASSQYNNAS